MDEYELIEPIFTESHKDNTSKTRNSDILVRLKRLKRIAFAFSIEKNSLPTGDIIFFGRSADLTNRVGQKDFFAHLPCPFSVKLANDHLEKGDSTIFILT